MLCITLFPHEDTAKIAVLTAIDMGVALCKPVTLTCCLMMARKLQIYKMDLKFAGLRKILLVIMTSLYKNVHSSKRLTIVDVFA